jgi:hypothetical protein
MGVELGILGSFRAMWALLHSPGPKAQVLCTVQINYSFVSKKVQPTSDDDDKRQRLRHEGVPRSRRLLVPPAVAPYSASPCVHHLRHSEIDRSHVTFTGMPEQCCCLTKKRVIAHFTVTKQALGLQDNSKVQFIQGPGSVRHNVDMLSEWDSKHMVQAR